LLPLFHPAARCRRPQQAAAVKAVPRHRTPKNLHPADLGLSLSAAMRSTTRCLSFFPATPSSSLAADFLMVLSLLADGLSNADIASRLGISNKTVRNHLSKLFDKLGVWTRAQAIVFARDHGFTR